MRNSDIYLAWAAATMQEHVEPQCFTAESSAQRSFYNPNNWLCEWEAVTILAISVKRGVVPYGATVYVQFAWDLYK